LTSEFERLRAKRDELKQRIVQQKANLAHEREEASRRAADMRSAADGLASQFKSLYAAASEAYAAEDGAAASSLSAQGKALQAQCEALNARANRLSAGDTSQAQDLKEAQNELAQVNQQLAELRKSAKQRGTWVDPTRHIRVSKFGQAKGVSETLVRHVLSAMPPRLLAEIQEVRYSTDISAGKLGSTDAKPQMKGKPTITLYRSIIEYDERTLRTMYTKTLLHETGHVIFERIAQPGQRLEWSNLFMRSIRDGKGCITEYADTGLREDVAECFMFYHLNPAALYADYPERYTFIDKLYKEVSK
jgi:hypothetical protein